MRSRAATLLRGPEDPGRATFLELFFDLVFVFALFRLSQGLLERLTWSGAFQTVVVLLAVFWVWGHTAGVANRFDPAQPPIQALVIGCMFGTFLLAVVAPEAFGPRGLVFAGAYVAVQVGRSFFLVLVTRGHERQRFELRTLFWFGVSAPLWLAGALAHGWARGVLWAVAVAVDSAAPRLGLPTPGLPSARPAEFSFLSEFVAERHRQFFIIALGELIVVSGLAYASGGLVADRTAAVVVAFVTTVLLWRIYIYRAGEVLGAAVAAAPDPLRVVNSVLYAHAVMVAGVVAISVGDELVIRHPSGHTRPAWIAVVLGGPALFLAGRAILEYAVFARVSRDHVIGVLVLAVISPAMILVPPLIAAAAAAVVLAGVAVVDAARARRRLSAEPPSPPGGPS
ncbi:low temperature requirement protein A [Plantactinospora solaniradicis]|uniref:Low temperature requirement protein A n=1 Tax=Plantactinospora solaniradicis TaxID=1723736 RepID=A0ABW1KG60_9ACTN